MSNKIGKRPKSFKAMRTERESKRNATAHFNGLTQSFASRDEVRAAMSVQTQPKAIRTDRSAEAANQIANAMKRVREGYQEDGSYVDRNGTRLSKAYQDNLQTDKPVLEGKGAKGELCNRTACQAPGAYWYNHSTQAYYCGTCADLINGDNANFKDSFLESLGHPLLTLDPDFADKGDERL